MFPTDKQVSRCLARLKAEEFYPLLDWLRAEESDTLRQMARSKDDAQTHRLQGRVLFIEQFWEALDKSHQ